MNAAFDALASPQLAQPSGRRTLTGHDAELVNVVTDGTANFGGYSMTTSTTVDWIALAGSAKQGRITERIERAQRQLAKSTRMSILADLPDSRELLERSWEERDVAWRSELLGAVIDRVVVDPPKRTGGRPVTDRHYLAGLTGSHRRHYHRPRQSTGAGLRSRAEAGRGHGFPVEEPVRDRGQRARRRNLAGETGPIGKVLRDTAKRERATVEEDPDPRRTRITRGRRPISAPG